MACCVALEQEIGNETVPSFALDRDGDELDRPERRPRTEPQPC